MFAQINIGILISQISLACITLFWIWMMIDAATKQPSVSRRVLWFIEILLLYFLGALVYFFVARKNSPRATTIAVAVIVLAAIGELSWMLF